MSNKDIELKDHTFNDLKIGQTDQFRRKIIDDNLTQFGRLTGDYNPIHYDSEYAEKTKFKGCIIQGLLTASFISPLIGMLLPGKQALYLSQNMKFIKPVRVGDELTVKGTVISKNFKDKTFILLTEINNQEYSLVLTGEAKILVRDDEFENE
ncbi:MAG: MaoC family dehydratase [bacterium]|nr:MaoC family dehydratase [bacterium]